MSTGLVRVRSRHDFQLTLERFRSAIRGAGLTIFAEIDHHASAVEAELQLPPTCLLLFGNPRVGTPLMRAIPELALELPFRAVVWSDITGITWITYSDPLWLAERFETGPSSARTWEGIRDGMKSLTATATN